MDKLINTLHPLERKVLPVLNKVSDLAGIAKESELQEVEVMRALQWLQNKKVLTIKEDVREVVILGKNGQNYAKHGLPEKRFLSAVKDKELPVEKIMEKAGLAKDEINICIGVLRSKVAVNIRKDKELLVSITEQGKKLLDKESLEEKFLKRAFPIETSSLKEEEKFALEALKKRKDIVKVDLVKTKSAELTDLGKKLSKHKISGEGIIDSLTPKMISSGAWKGKSFRRFDVKINVPMISGGKRHFVSQAVEYIRKIWLEMGFKEMTGSLIQTAFWDLDSLFVPQDHPARQMQDTFYIKDPHSGKLPSPLWKKVKEAHENGADTGSTGWGGNWSEAESKKNLLRTHTTVLSAQAISRLKESDLPAKFFSVARVFRNEALDWKHLFELTQVEGIVVDPKANMKYLKGYLREFFGKMGYDDVRIRPAYFPYTEPSAEVDVLHPDKNQWIELGGSGIFRPEVVKPLLGIEVPVLAWGLGMERTISEYFDINDIRELYKNDLKQIRGMKSWMR